MSTYKERLWTKDFVILFIYSFLLMLAFFLLMVSISGYAIQTFNVSTSTAGLVAGIFIIGSLFGRIVTGHQVKVHGAKKIMYIGAVMFIVTYGMYFFANHLVLLLIVRFLNGVANGVATTAVGTLAAVSLPESRRGEGIGYFSLNFVLATAIGPFLSFWLIQYIDYNTMFMMVFVIVLIASVFTLFVKSNTEALPKGEKVKFEWIDKNALPIGGVVLIICMSYSTVLSFLSLYAEERNLVAISSYYFVLYAIVIMISRPITGRIMDQTGANKVMYPAFLVMSLGFLTLGFGHTWYTVLLAAIFLGFGYGNIQSLSQAIAVKVAAPQNIGLATSTYFIALDFGLGVGSYIFGFLVPVVGFTGLYVAMAMIVMCVLVLYHLVHGRIEMNQR